VEKIIPSQNNISRNQGTVVHPLEPVFDNCSRVLILGTMPSPRSRVEGFYYGHPQNRFWRVMADLFHEKIPSDKSAKVSFLLRRHVALWDLLHSCSISGADDNTIRDPVPNDFRQILSASDIRAIFTTGKKATQLYTRYCLPLTGIPSIYLPSTSPANCARTGYEDLLRAYSAILEWI
jgi:TDG/mug DNA glycosylase family protein